MPSYGFRLYTVKLVAGFGKAKPIEFDKCGKDQAQHVGTWMRRAFATLEGYGPLTKMPQQRHAEGDVLPLISSYEQDGDRDDPRTNFHSHTASPTTRIRFEFNYGRVGRFPYAFGRTEADDIPLKDHATGHRYRGLLYLPKAGTNGVLALESIPSSAHPVESLNAWLARAAADVAAEDAAAIEALPVEQLDGLAALPYKLNFTQFANLARLEKMIKESADAELVLRKTVISSSGKAKTEKLKLVHHIETKGERAAAVGVAHKLYGKIVNADGETAGLAELEGLAPGDVSGFEFNDGYIKLDDGSGGSKKIGVDKVDKYFEYSIGSSVRPSSTKWEQAVAKEVVSLQGFLKVELDVS